MTQVTEEQAEKKLNEYAGVYHNLAIAHYKLARQEGKSVSESLDAVAKKIVEATTAAINSK